MSRRILTAMARVTLSAGLCALVSCSMKPSPPPPSDPPPPARPTYEKPTRHSGIQDFGEPNALRLAQRFRTIQARVAPAQVLNILQLGDSHTSSDTFTSGLRRELQRDLGDAGIGWLTPMNVRGQSHQLVKLKSRHWHLTTSRVDDSPHFPLGGYIASPTKAGARLEVELRQPDAARYIATFLVRPAAALPPLKLVDAVGQAHVLTPNGLIDGWGYASAEVRLPLTIVADAKGSAQLGGIWLTKPDVPGVLVSPIGANGVRQEVWNKWSTAWLGQLSHMQADLVILAYGTNEAFNDRLDPDAMARELATGIRQVRQALPHAAVLMIAAPDAMVAASDPQLPCAERRPVMHAAVKRVQHEVAQQEKVLYWDWETAMGGQCPMLEWQELGLVGKDLVHFTGAGYKESAQRFHADLMEFLARQ